MIRVVKVNGLRTREGRAAVCYCGRRFAGWPQSAWHNPFKVGDPSPGNRAVKIDRGHALELFRHYVESLREGGTLDAWLAELWEACDHGRKPLGCWCCDWDGASEPAPQCHAVTLSQMLMDRFATVEVP